jgi:hypothetical protein
MANTLGSQCTHPQSTWSEVYVGIETQLLDRFHWDRNPWVRSLRAPRVVSIPGVSIPPYAWIPCVS